MKIDLEVSMSFLPQEVDEYVEAHKKLVYSNNGFNCVVFLRDYLKRFAGVELSFPYDWKKRVLKRDYEYFWKKLKPQVNVNSAKEPHSTGDILLFVHQEELKGYGIIGETRVHLVDEVAGVVSVRQQIKKYATHIIRLT